MHGAILTELEKFVTQQHGAHAWREVQRRPDLPKICSEIDPWSLPQAHHPISGSALCTLVTRSRSWAFRGLTSPSSPGAFAQRQRGRKCWIGIWPTRSLSLVSTSR